MQQAVPLLRYYFPPLPLILFVFFYNLLVSLIGSAEVNLVPSRKLNEALSISAIETLTMFLLITSLSTSFKGVCNSSQI